MMVNHQRDGRPSDRQADAKAQPAAVSAPSLSLPKGGGAIRGIGEKFGANPVTGTGSMTVPIATSPGRSGFGPQLSLSYDSGAGNGPFGFGWSLSLPSIARKTDKGLPTYQDADESDVFILSGAEDLVPILIKKEDGTWEREQIPPRTINENTYHIHRYRPRVEGLFARIERWTSVETGETHWRSITRDNVTTLYGKDNNSRIFDPDDPNPEHPTRIFSWLICQSYDDKGNAIIYKYQREDSQRIFEDQQGQFVALAHERNRDETSRSANRYLKRIKYGNRTPNRDATTWQATDAAQLPNETWMFEVVFDYSEGHYMEDEPDAEGRVFARAHIDPPAGSHWPARQDPFSSYRAGFEVRTYRLCQRVLMFHHFPDEADVGNDCLVRSTEFTYSHEQDPTSARNPVYTFLRAVSQSGYKRDNGGYLKRSLPPVEFEYTQPVVQDAVEEVEAESLENLPIGLDGAAYQWTDLHGEGIPGIITEQAGAWFYKRNLSPISVKPGNGSAHTEAKFAPVELVAVKPNLTLAGGQAQFMDLAGDGQPDLVVLDGAVPGLYEHDGAEGWHPFRPFTSRLNRDTRDPNLKFVDLDGNGHADILIAEDDAFVWHASLAEAGFGPARRVAQALDEEKGPRLVFADGTQSIYLADLSGDGLTDLVRIRNGEVCYWPNLGYGRFGAKVTMDHAPHFDNPDQFDHKRIRLADIDGTGTTDIIYLHRDGVRLYFNQSGNSWSAPQPLRVFPRIDDLAGITAVDLLGNGTACLVWSSPLPGDTRRPMCYVDLMGGQKPHLLVRSVNNLGAETRVVYAPSTKFYLQDKHDGKSWITRLPFPVHVVERVETYDHISRNRFVTRHAYHHGYFDGEEREFRGFGMVEQWDTETFVALTADGTLADATNLDTASHVPPVLTRTWFHTGIHLDREPISRQFESEYYREPGLNDQEFLALLLPDTTLPAGLTLGEEREACRALKGSMLRQEVYALDGMPKEGHPYVVTEQNFTIRPLQPRGENRHGVFFTHAREAVNYHYERKLFPVLNGQIVDDATAAANPDVRWRLDPRVQHSLTLEVDPFGNVLKSATIGFGRRFDAPDAGLLPEDRARQRLIHITYTENTFTRPFRVGIDAADGGTSEAVDEADAFRAPLPAASRTYELRKPQQERTPDDRTTLFRFDDVVAHAIQAGDGDHEVNYEDLDFTRAKQAAANDPVQNGKYFRRLIEHVRTLYRPDDLGVAQNDPLTLLPLGTVGSLALPGESYKLAFTPGLLTQVFQRNGQPLLPDPANVLGGQGADRGGYLPSQQLKAEGRFPNTDPDDYWWIPAGRVSLSPNPNATAVEELAHARSHFFLQHRYRDPFHTIPVSTESFVSYDAYDLLMVETRDALDNRVTVGERDAAGNLVTPGNDYRVLQPRLMMDPNRNRTAVAFDALGMVVGTAVMGKPLPAPVEGDSLDGFEADLTEAVTLDHLAKPMADPQAILARATTRLVYDLFAYQRTKDQPDPQPAVVYTLARETHDSDPIPAGGLKIQHSFSYSDGFGREIQKKIQAEPGPLVEDGPEVNPRWVGSGWTIFNNKGKPVRQYEPFFSATHRFEFGVQVGVSPILFYDPLERVIATLHPNHTYEKVVFDPWRQTMWDVNDTVLGDPRTDADIRGYTAGYFAGLPASPPAPPWQTWLTQRQGGGLGAQEQAAASKATAHADTPTTAYSDTLGRPFLTAAHNKVVCPNHDLDGTDDKFHTRVELDIEGNQRAVRDAIVQNGDAQGRIVMRYAYDMLGNRIHHLSMEAGARWMLNDVAGNPIRAWDSRGHSFRTEYDPLRRPLRAFVTGADPANPSQELLTERLVYGEQHPEDELRNLRGQLYLHLDQAGAATSEAYDFKDNLLHASRRIARDYKRAIDWSAVNAALPANATAELNPVTLEAVIMPLLEADSYTSRTTYDALNRPVTLTTPHTPTMQPNVIRPGYNEANLLERLEANLRGATANDQPVWTPFVTNIDYDAKGQRTRIDYGNGVSTFYGYDPLTFRLVHLHSRRDLIAFPDDCPEPPPADWPGCEVQNLHYTYDPVGNITHIRDDAQQTIYFRNKRVEPSADYTYDALYRLIQATAREHLGQIDGAPIPHSHNDAPRMGLHPGDGNAMGTYIERYVYDAVGNFLQMQHRGSDPAYHGWTRSYEYAEASLIEPAKQRNRLSRTTIGNGNPITERYVHDAHGNMTRMPHLGGAHPGPNIYWDYQDQLNRADLAGGGTAYYTYDAAGDRVRKVWEKSANLIEERLYLGGFEIYRRRNGMGTVTLERETLHITDDQQRIGLAETRTLDTAGTDTAPQRRIRYQFGNHLGSASLELDDQAQIISYEEYTPYGSTSYQAVRNQIETPKRYRYTGKERDEESGLYYHEARYYAPWLGRWTSIEPEGVEEDTSLFLYVKANPISFTDPDGEQARPASKVVEKVAIRGLKWLSSRGKTVAAHPAKKHAQGGWRSFVRLGNTEVEATARRALLKRFEGSKLIKGQQAKKLAERTLRGFDPEHVLVQGNRYVFQRAFKREIGREGETVFRVVVDKATGKIVTWFPSHTFRALAIAGVGASTAFEASIAEAAETGERSREAHAERAGGGIWDWILPIGVSQIGWEPNMGTMRRLGDEAIEGIEDAGQVSLSLEDRREIRAAIERTYVGQLPYEEVALDWPEDDIYSDIAEPELNQTR